MRILAGRHPVIERLADEEAGRFIPNDLYLERATEPDRHHHRPEHGRQVHLPAAGGADRDPGADGLVRAGRVGRAAAVDRIFTRIGASDNLARGRSTFMVEMTETAAS